MGRPDVFGAPENSFAAGDKKGALESRHSAEKSLESRRAGEEHVNSLEQPQHTTELTPETNHRLGR